MLSREEGRIEERTGRVAETKRDGAGLVIGCQWLTKFHLAIGGGSSENGASECRSVRTSRRINANREHDDLAWYGLGCVDSWRLVRGCALNGRVNSS